LLPTADAAFAADFLGIPKEICNGTANTTYSITFYKYFALAIRCNRHDSSNLGIEGLISFLRLINYETNQEIPKLLVISS